MKDRRKNQTGNKSHFEFPRFSVRTVAHDLNNTLTAVSGNVTLLLLKENLDEESYQLLIDIEKALTQSKYLTQRLFSIAAEDDPIKEETSITHLLKESVIYCPANARINYNFHFPGKLWKVDIDRVQIGEVLQNLTINACQAMANGGVIEFSAKNIVVETDNTPPLQQGKYVKVTIKDQGIGISRKHLDKIFDPYFTTKQAGSGLGLAIALSIVGKHQGCIKVESEIGRGTSFHVYLPATE